MSKSIGRVQYLLTSKKDIQSFELCTERIEKVDFIVREDPNLAIELGASGVLIADLNACLPAGRLDIRALRKEFPNLLFGGLAHNAADCKNWELRNVDFIQLASPSNSKDSTGLSSILGSEVFTNLIPKEEAYGWMIMSLNTPVIVDGLKSLDELKNLVQRAAISGMLLSKDFEPELDHHQRISQILEILH